VLPQQLKFLRKPFLRFHLVVQANLLQTLVAEVPLRPLDELQQRQSSLIKIFAANSRIWIGGENI
jgi:hypothetical protein